MVLSDTAVRRPVLATVISLLLVAFGLVSYDRLALREYPDIDPPIVSIDINYPGASAAVVETQITELIEDRISGIEGIRFIQSSSADGRSTVNVEFTTGRDVDAAANDIRDRVFGALDNLPEDANQPEISKVDADADVIMWLNLTSETMDLLELTDYARRYLQDRFSVLPGVARIRIGGSFDYAMRIWIDRKLLAAHGLTVNDIESALVSENVELPAGQIQSEDRVFTARVSRSYRTPEDFKQLVIGKGRDGHLVRLSEVARVEKGAAEDRTFFRGNGIAMVGLGIIKQSTANTLEVARAAKSLKERVNQTLPKGTVIEQSYDTSVFIESAIYEVWKTLLIAIGLVVLVIYVFLRDLRATLVPALTVPVSLVATFTALYMLGFSVNLLTLLALVLSVGLVVDDSIVMLENVHRRIDLGESPLVAAFRGARQVGFAVVATSVVLVAVFVPISFLQGDIGRLFSEFSLTMAAAVFFSTIVALTLSPMLCSKLLKPHTGLSDNGHRSQRFGQLLAFYERNLRRAVRRPMAIGLVFMLLTLAMVGLFKLVPQEYAPKEDRGAFFVMINGPEGASFDYMLDYIEEIERRLMPLTESGEVRRLLIRAPRSFGGVQRFDSGIAILVLNDWSQRRSAWEMMDAINRDTADLSGVRVFTVMRQGFGGGIQKPVQFVLGGGTYEELAEWRDILNTEIAKDNPGLTAIDWDYKETQPQLRIEIDRNRAADLGVSVADVGRTLQVMLGSRQVTTFIDEGEEYDVILEGERGLQRTQSSIDNLYVRSTSSNQVIPLSNLVKLYEQAGATTLNRYNRVRAITLEASLADTLVLDDALSYLEDKVRAVLPSDAVIDYKGQSQDLREAGGSIVFIFALGLVVVFLVLAAQFENYVQPLVIMLTVPLAIAGALFGLWITGGTLNIYSQIGLVMLVGLAAKNGILIVEFANQLRDEGKAFEEALIEASCVRLRPILMTGITTAAGAIPLILSSGAGSETRATIGVVVLFGVLAATAFTAFVVPTAYAVLARHTTSPLTTTRQLERETRAQQEPLE